MPIDATIMMPALQFRFAHKFGKLSAGAKRGDSTQVYRGCAAGSGEISARGFAKRFVPGRSVVRTLPRAQRRMVGKRAIQLRVVRPIFCGLPFLASLAGPAAGGNSKSQIANRKFSSPYDGDCCVAVAAADTSL